MFSIFGRSGLYSINSLRMYFITWNILVNFYLPHWEKYNTGVLFLPWGYDLSMWFTIIVFLITGVTIYFLKVVNYKFYYFLLLNKLHVFFLFQFFGHEIWQFMIPGGITASVMFEFVLYVSSLGSNLPVILYNIYLSYKNKTGYMRSFTEAVRPLVPVVIFLILTSIWACKTSFLLDRDPRALYFLTGTIFSNICVSNIFKCTEISLIRF